MLAVLRSVLVKTVWVNDVFPLHVHISYFWVFVDDCGLNHVVSVFFAELIDRRVQTALLFVFF